MRNLTFVLIWTVIPFLGFSQNGITGKVVDELGLPIYLASVTLEQTGDIVYTDFEGNFSLISATEFHWKISIASAGYQTESFFVLSGGHTGDLVLDYSVEMNELLENDP